MLKGSYLWRALLSIAVGLIVVIWPSFTAKFIVIIIGMALILAGIIMLIGHYLPKRKDDSKPVPATHLLVDVVCVIAGVLLVLLHGIFISVLIMLMGVLLLLIAIDRIWALVKASRAGEKTPWLMYALPALIFIAGVVMVANPHGSVKLMLIIFGVMAILYGVTELVNRFFVRKGGEEMPQQA